jgi:hypothetical protein
LVVNKGRAGGGEEQEEEEVDNNDNCDDVSICYYIYSTKVSFLKF